jgi:hypothetical protein
MIAITTSNSTSVKAGRDAPGPGLGPHRLRGIARRSFPEWRNPVALLESRFMWLPFVQLFRTA